MLVGHQVALKPDFLGTPKPLIDLRKRPKKDQKDRESEKDNRQTEGGEKLPECLHGAV